ncbi:SH3 domain-containing protein [Leptospira jelokensis]|uniref:SH3 domain-containing protein n=1 Tax=Leptospira jelokensis TaxID=2484931 RepID=UPI001090DDF8|nr:SH3 domain-containing protein [Leptospira jelokensis]TGM03180.1 SH3 domain-containing protein [Leptospira jelokensis]
MLRITILIFSFIFACQEDSKINNSTPSDSNAESATKQELEIEKQCVGVKSGLRLRSQPNLDGEKIDLIPYQSIVSILKIGDPISIDNIYSKWAKVEFQDKVGWVFMGYLNWDCTEYNFPDASKITEENVYGKFLDNQHGGNFNIYFQENNIYRTSIFGGCDDGGCNIENDFGEWRVFNNLIYLRSKSNLKLNSDLFIFYISKDKSLNPVDREHAIFENYGTDIISGWKRDKK